ncbi:MAG: hypothetical protein EXS08_13590, partial [Planctomycetes bacterium]|nr:hypothetical protein [Planctomycetota bacterium]
MSAVPSGFESFGSRARLLAALVLVPLLLFGPIVAAGQVFLPFLPVIDEPLAGENPAAAAEARASIHATMGDRVYPFLTDQLAARAELREGHLPTWEPLQTLGMPLFGGNVAALGYPLNWLAFLMPPEYAAAPLAFVALFLAGLGTWLFLRRIELDERAALVGALSVQLGGWGLANLFYYMKVDAALWLPWALWGVEGLARRKRWSATALMAAITLSFLGGMVSVSVFVLGATALYALVRLWRARSADERGGARALVGAGLCLALGVAGAAYWILPVSEAASASRRREMTSAAALASALPPLSALGVLVPDLAGAPDDPTPTGNLAVPWWLTPASMSARAENANVLEWNAYALVAVVLLALAGVVSDPRRTAFPALLLLGTFAFAQAWPLVRVLFALPGLALGPPQRVLALAWILWPWLAALGVEALLARRPRALGTLLVGGFGLALGAFLVWRGIEPRAWAAELQATILERYAGLTTPAEVSARLPLELCMDAARALQESLLRAGAAALAVFVAGALALVLDRQRTRFEQPPPRAALALGLLAPLAVGLLPFVLGADFSARGPQALLALAAVVALAGLVARAGRGELALWFPFAALLLLEGFLGSYRNVQGRSVTTAELFPPSATIERIRAAAGDGRVLRLDGTAELSEATRLARPNLLVAYGIAELTPYPTFTPRQAAELAERIDPRMVRRNHVAPLPSAELLGSPLLDLLRAQCVLSVAPLVHPRLEPVLEQPGFCVYRRRGALSAARIVPVAHPSTSDEGVLARLSAPDVDFAAATELAPEDSARAAEFAADTAWVAGTITAVEHPARNRVRVIVRGSHGGWLVLHEQWARGWEARVNGAPTALARADHAYRAVLVPPGELVVEFEYAPRSLQWGATLALLALAA